MAKTVLTGCRIFAGGADLTGASNKCELSVEAEDKDVTTFDSDGWKESIGGLKSGTVSGSGYWEAGDDGKVDDETWADLGDAAVPFTVAPVAATVGSLAYVAKTFRKNYKLLGQVGDVAPWEAEASSNWPVARGLVFHPPGTARTSSGTGTGAELAAVASGQALYAALHVLSVSGTDTPTLTVVVESDVDADFEDPQTVATFSDATAISSQILRSTTANTDTYYRVTWTVSGTSPSFQFVCSLGVA
jgi:hypothetical protein